jgi:hypothetical protein
MADKVGLPPVEETAVMAAEFGGERVAESTSPFSSKRID